MVDVCIQCFFVLYFGLDIYFFRDFQNKEFVVFDVGGFIVDYFILVVFNDFIFIEEQCEECVFFCFFIVYNYYEDKVVMIGDIVMMVIFDGFCEFLMYCICCYVGVDFKYVYVCDFFECFGVYFIDYCKVCFMLFLIFFDVWMIMYIFDIVIVEYFNEINVLF